MADLSPILRPGAAGNADLQLYTARDFIGADKPTDTELRGINRCCQWTRDVGGWIDVEHDRNGVHDTIKIPRGVLILTWVSTGGINGFYEIDPRSYLMGVRYADDPSIYSTTLGANSGDFTLHLGLAMPTAKWGILAPATFDRRTPIGGTAQDVAVRISGVAQDERTMEIKRRADIGGTDDGNMTLLLVG